MEVAAPIDYEISGDNYYKSEYKKYQIIIGNTHNIGMNHTIGWSNRLGGRYKKTAPLKIKLDGQVY